MSSVDKRQDALRQPSGTWLRLRTVFGPTLVGLIGGSLSGLMVLPAMAPLCRNAAATYGRYPSLERPWLATELPLPAWLSAAAMVIGLAAPLGLGAGTVWLARSRDIWSDLSNGLTTALASTLTAFVFCFGWPAILALVVVPSIHDLTNLSDSVRQTEPATTTGSPAPPSQPLDQRYGDLAKVEPQQRGQVLMAKIVADQAMASAQAVWLGMLMALLSVGSLALSGTLAAGYLWRRGDRFRSCVMPYCEMTLPLTAAVAVTVGTAFSSIWSTVTAGALPLLSMVGLTALAIAGVVHRWPWTMRLALAFTWFLVLIRITGESMPWVIPGVAMALTGYLLWRQFVTRSVRIETAPIEAS